jgi:uncharacterized membrane protein
MPDKKTSISWFGLGLVVVGGLLLMGKMELFHLRFSSIFWPVIMLLSIFGVGRGFSQLRRGKIFWGTFGFLYGLFFFLRSADFVDVPARLFVPATFLIVGISLFMTYLAKVKDWFFLIPAGIAGAVGTLFLLADLEYLSYWEVADTLHMYWPVILIALGVIFLFRRKPDSTAGHPVS